MIPQKDCCSVQQASCYHKDKLKDEAFSDVIKKTFRICFGDKTIVGKNFRAYYQPISSEVKDTGFFQNGAEAVWERLYGAGKVIALGTTLSACYPAKENYVFYSVLGKTEEWKAPFPCGIRADFVSEEEDVFFDCGQSRPRGICLSIEKIFRSIVFTL